MIRNVQGQTNIKDNFNFVQSMTDTHSDKVTLWIIELLTTQLKKITFVISGGRGVKNYQNVIFLKVEFKIHFKLF